MLSHLRISSSLGFSVSYNGSVLITPPKKINQTYYRCDNKFHLDEILEMYEKEEKYGIVLVSGDTCKIYNIIKTGTQIQIKEMKTAAVHQLKGHKKGGQSAPRFQRLRDENEEAQVKKVAEQVVNQFWDYGKSSATIRSLLLGGPAELKNKLRDHSLIKQYFNSIIVGVITTPSIDDRLVYDVYEQNKELLGSLKDKESLSVIKKVENLIEKCDDRLIFGLEEAKENLQICLLERLVISSKVDKKEIDELQTHCSYGCRLYVINHSLLENSKLAGIEIIGLKFY